MNVPRRAALFSAVVLGAMTACLTACGSGPNAPLPNSSKLAAAHLGLLGQFRTIFRFPLWRKRPYGAGGQLLDVGGLFYGTTSFGGDEVFGGTVFSITPSGEKHTVLKLRYKEGNEPNPGLIDVNGILYGTASGGGHRCAEFGCGTVFSVTPSGAERTLYRFKGGSDGESPSGGLVWLDGKFYGTTSAGGTTSVCPRSTSGTGCGTIFSIDTSGNERVLYRFQGNGDGATPRGPLLALNGKLYGTTVLGGASGNCDYDCGTLFEITTSGTKTMLHDFQGGSDGSAPTGGLIAVEGTIYGTTGNIFATCCGTFYKITTSGAETVLYDFKRPPDADNPNGSLIFDHGRFYGTGGGGKSCGYSDSGTIYSVSTTGDERVEYTFSCKSANAPSQGLLAHDGMLYGTASDTIFALRL